MAASSPSEFACSLSIGDQTNCLDDEPADWNSTRKRKQRLKETFAKWTASGAFASCASHFTRT